MPKQFNIKLMPDLAKTEKLFKLPKNRKLMVIMLVVLLLALIPSGYFYLQYRKTQDLLQNPSKQADQQAQEVVNQVGKLIELPTNERPTIATVTDKTKLEDQPFFAHAENGDRVLIYANAKKAILYRPSENKLIEVSAYVSPQANLPTAVPQKPSASPTPTVATKTYKVAIYNGTKVSGFASKTAAKIEGQEFTVVSKGDSVGNNYTQTIVVDLGGGKTAANDLAVVVNGKVGSLPKEEKSPSNADFLVILGSSE